MSVNGADVASNTRMVKIEEVQPLGRSERIASHSHVKGLGLDPKTLKALPKAAGFIGQMGAREATGVVVDLIKAKRFPGRCLMLAGPPGTGKTAIALAVSQELGDKVPFVPMTGSEVFSAEVKKTEILMENFRRAIGLRIKEKKEVYEGEVTKLEPVETENPVSGYGKAISHVIVELKTVKGGKQLKLDPSIYDQLLKQRVERGDVIYIEANTGTVKRVGRCDVYATDFDLEADEFVPLPKGDVHKTKEVVQDVTLHDLDMANARPSGRGEMSGLIHQLLKPKKTEITDRLRSEINKIVNEFIDQGTAELMPGVLFIDEVHMLDTECFAYLNRALETSHAPIVILATNRVSEDSETRVMGVPRDLIDRVLLVTTDYYTSDDIRQILSMRADAEGVQLEEDAARQLTQLGDEQSLRYVVQLLTPCKVLAQSNGREKVSKQDVLDASRMFSASCDKADLLQGDEQLGWDRDEDAWQGDLRSDDPAQTADEDVLADLRKLDQIFAEMSQTPMETA